MNPGFIQLKPERGRMAAYATEARVLIASDRLIVGFICRDPEPEPITARLTRRDSALTEDNCVCVALGTFFDRRTDSPANPCRSGRPSDRFPVLVKNLVPVPCGAGKLMHPPGSTRPAIRRPETS